MTAIGRERKPLGQLGPKDPPGQENRKPIPFSPYPVSPISLFGEKENHGPVKHVKVMTRSKKKQKPLNKKEEFFFSILEKKYSNPSITVSERLLNRLLEDKDIDINSKSLRDWPPLMYAVLSNDLKMVKLFAGSGAEIDFQGTGGWTSLMLAAFNGRNKIVEFLVDKGASVGLKNFGGYSSSTLASDQGHAEVALFLYEKELMDPKSEISSTEIKDKEFELFLEKINKIIEL